jgi:hypothetical protein
MFLPQCGYYYGKKNHIPHVLKIKESYTPPKISDNTYKFIGRLGLVVRIREKGGLGAPPGSSPLGYDARPGWGVADPPEDLEYDVVVLRADRCLEARFLAVNMWGGVYGSLIFRTWVYGSYYRLTKLGPT